MATKDEYTKRVDVDKKTHITSQYFYIVPTTEKGKLCAALGIITENRRKGKAKNQRFRN